MYMDNQADSHTGCTSRTAHHNQLLKNNMVTRLKKIEGQVRAISRMIDQDVYCDDVLNQIAAVESAMDGVKRLLLEAHKKSCVVEQIAAGKHEVVDELIKTIKKLMR